MTIIGKIKKRIGRFLHKRKLYIYPSTQDGWKQLDKEILNDNGKTYFDPYVLKGTNYLYISNRDQRSISRFEFDIVSKTLRNEICVLKANPNTWEDDLNRACVVKLEDKFFCYYVGQFQGKSCIGLATSSDGVNFVRNKTNPILIPEFNFEKCSVMNPSVIYDSGSFKMWYAAGETYEPDVICYAESKDGINWIKKESPVFIKGKDKYDCYKVGGPDVFKTEKEFVMLYIGYQNIDNARICLAHSKDGLSWDRDSNNPIVSPVKNAWNSDACYKPAYFYDLKNDISYIFFNGRKGHHETIGAAFKEGKL